MKHLLSFSRWFVGLLFIFSGLIKANDPMGLSYKMQEFFEVWGIHFLNDYSLIFSIAMIAFEIIAGVAVIIGWQFKLFSWLLLLLILFFTFLTGYALFSGNIRECGCFGDCIKLTARDSFIKDLVLSAFILLLFTRRFTINSTLQPSVAQYIMIITTIFSFGSQFYVLRHLPVMDCLPYKEGVNILEGRKIPAGAIPDSTVITFVYEHQGKKLEFDADHFPADFNDSTYLFVDRYDKVVRKGNAEPPIKDFVLKSPGGTDSTEAILSQPGKLIIVFCKTWKPDWKEDVNLLEKEAKEKNIPILVSTSVADEVEKDLKIPVMRSDFVAIKTAARVDPTIYLLDNGTIKRKWAINDLDKAIEQIKAE